MEIPYFLSHLQVFQGLPVPFAQMTINGVPDFRVIDTDKVFLCLNERLCGICGRKMAKTAWFVGGPGSLESGWFTDPPMHEPCARFAVEICPYLSGKKTEANTVRPVNVPDDTKIEVCPLMPLERPEKIGMRRASNYGLHRHCGHNYIVVRRWYGLPLYLA